MKTSKLERLFEVQVQMEAVQMASRPDGEAWKRAWRARERWTPRWEKAYHDLLVDSLDTIHWPDLLKAADKAWGRGVLRKGVVKGLIKWVLDHLRLDIDEGGFTEGAMRVYVGLAHDEANEAGQFTLDALGIGETFDWAGIRDIGPDPFAVHGSKVVQGIYGTHVETLARLVMDKTTPSNPTNINKLRADIKREWPALATWQAKRIAQTEAANVWETMHANAMRLNGVPRVDWLVASGPAIGVRVGPVCKRCLKLAAGGPYTFADLETTPPLHPNCRCTLVPNVSATWLPPAQPWTGAAKPLRTYPQ